MQAVDGLRTSEKLLALAKKNIADELTDEEVLDAIENFGDDADIAAARFFYLISKKRFTLEYETLIDIHKFIFRDLSDDAGKLRRKYMSKKEIALDGLSLAYPNPKRIRIQMRNLFKKEAEFSAEGLDSKKTVHHIAMFISGLWKTHPFAAGNTRAVAAFFIEYLAFRGFALSNDVLARNPIYFRNALVRAVFSDKERKIKTAPRFLEKFIKAMLFNPKAKFDSDECNLNGKPAKSTPQKKSAASKKTAPSKKAPVLKNNAGAKEAAVKKTPAHKKSLDPEGAVIKGAGSTKATAEKKAGAKKSGTEAAETTEIIIQKKPAKKNALQADGVVIKEAAPEKTARAVPEKKSPEKKSARDTAAKAKTKKNAEAKSKPGEKKSTRATATGSKAASVATKTNATSVAKENKATHNADEKKIIAFLKKHKKITNKEARECAEISTESARRILTDLCEKKIVRAEGKNKARIYIMN